MHNVIQNTDHEDFENLAVCSGHLFNLTKEEREKMLQKYYVIRCGTTWEDGVELFQPLPLLQEIVSCPRIASFPTKMIIGDCNTEGLESQIEEEDISARALEPYDISSTSIVAHSWHIRLLGRRRNGSLPCRVAC